MLLKNVDTGSGKNRDVPLFTDSTYLVRILRIVAIGARHQPFIRFAKLLIEPEWEREGIFRALEQYWGDVAAERYMNS